jgi:hypothetical protein
MMSNHNCNYKWILTLILVLLFSITPSTSESGSLADWLNRKGWKEENWGRKPKKEKRDWTELKRVLVQRREAIKKWAITCKEDEYLGQYSEHRDKCHQGDLTIFAGISCLAAFLAGDRDTYEARCPNGRWFRGPIRVNNKKKMNRSFSRDQLYGISAYFIARGILDPDPDVRERTKDQAKKWLGWVDRHDGVMCDPNPNGICNFSGGMQHHIWKMMGILSDKGISEYESSETIKKMYKSKSEYKRLFWEILGSRVGSPLHLTALSVFLYRTLYGDKISKDMKKVMDFAASFIHNKDRDNIFYEFLDKGKQKSMIKKLLDRCPCDAPNVEKFDWQFQRKSSLKRWERTIGHDCIFVINMLLIQLKDH